MITNTADKRLNWKVASAILSIATAFSVSATTESYAAGCRLDTQQCAIIAQEIAIESVNIINDRRSFGFSMRPAQRGLALIDRHYARRAERFKHLPPAIANEMARMSHCDLVADQGSAKPDPRCE